MTDKKIMNCAMVGININTGGISRGILRRLQECISYSEHHKQFLFKL